MLAVVAIVLAGVVHPARMRHGRVIVGGGSLRAQHGLVIMAGRVHQHGGGRRRAGRARQHAGRGHALEGQREQQEQHQQGTQEGFHAAILACGPGPPWRKIVLVSLILYATMSVQARGASA